ncbi:hypothetical protein AB0K00_46280 [Dactylosporangium sp. NPDC049525]|uniref:hypothetical protein n=1 Tax=Dactylosporangium sp. NPDC049525 TaxID=3154730 RepID=UPI003412BEAF
MTTTVTVTNTGSAAATVELYEPTDLPWLSATPAAFTLGAGRSRTVTVTLTASAGGQPGVYNARLAVRTGTPHPR